MHNDFPLPFLFARTLRRPLLWLALQACALHAGLGHAQTTPPIVYSYQYDAQGNLIKITDPLGHVTSQSYDALQRMTQQVQPAPAAGVATPVIKYGYDGLDQLISVTDPRSLKTSYTMTGLGEQTALASPDTGTANSTYDAAGNLLTHTDAKGQITT